MALFPIFVDLKDKKCVFVGGGEVAVRKIKSLLEFGACINVISLDACKEIKNLHADGKLVYKQGMYEENSLDGAYLVFAATSDRELNRRISYDASSKGILVNVADCPDECTFTFPSIVKRDEFVVGISSSGSYPALSKFVRKKIEQMLPESYGSALEVLKPYRDRVITEVKDKKSKKELLNKLLETVLSEYKILRREQLKNKIESMIEGCINEENHKGRQP